MAPRARPDRPTAKQTQALMAIELLGGEICRLTYGDSVRWVAVDRFGRARAGFDGRTMNALARRGRLLLKRFERGGAVYSVNPVALSRLDARAERPAPRRPSWTDAWRAPEKRISEKPISEKRISVQCVSEQRAPDHPAPHKTTPRWASAPEPSPPRPAARRERRIAPPATPHPAVFGAVGAVPAPTPSHR